MPAAGVEQPRGGAPQARRGCRGPGGRPGPAPPRTPIDFAPLRPYRARNLTFVWRLLLSCAFFGLSAFLARRRPSAWRPSGPRLCTARARRSWRWRTLATPPAHSGRGSSWNPATRLVPAPAPTASRQALLLSARGFFEHTSLFSWRAAKKTPLFLQCRQAMKKKFDEAIARGKANSWGTSLHLTFFALLH